jgi:hypothetical protein
MNYAMTEAILGNGYMLSRHRRICHSTNHINIDMTGTTAVINTSKYRDVTTTRHLQPPLFVLRESYLRKYSTDAGRQHIVEVYTA